MTLSVIQLNDLYLLLESTAVTGGCAGGGGVVEEGDEGAQGDVAARHRDLAHRWGEGQKILK